MRVNRALEKFRHALAKRGVTSTAAALATVLAPHAVASVPASSAQAIASIALSQSVLPAAGTTGLFVVEFMSSAKTTACFVVLSFAAALTAIHQTRALNRAEAALVQSRTQQEILSKRADDLETRLQASENRTRETERDNDLLINAAESLSSFNARPVMPEQITHDSVDARYKRAQSLARSGQNEAALTDYLWCFDTGMKQISSYSGVRLSFLLNSIVDLGKSYPPALAALRERRSALEQRVAENDTYFETLSDFAGINHALNDDARTLQLFESFPPESKQRSMIAYQVADQLIEARRYRELAEAMPYSRMKQMFELTTRDLDEMPSHIKQHVVSSTARNVEVLAGAGDTQHARELLNQVLALDSSTETKALLQKHLARANNPELSSVP